MAQIKTVIAFDLYGTILSTESIAEILAKHFGKEASSSLAAAWRRYQLEYTWRITCMGKPPLTNLSARAALTINAGIYKDFSKITRASLKHAVAEQGKELSEEAEEELIKGYDALHVFPEVGDALKAVESESSVEAYIFSNGTVDRVKASIQSSPDLSPYAKLFKDLVTVEDTQAFKPAMSVYDHLLKAVGKGGRAKDVWLVSANPFDAVGAEVAGLRAAWIDRAGKGWVDRLGDVVGDIRPTIVVPGVDEAIAEILRKF
jgi:2-haloacid dehalogenase